MPPSSSTGSGGGAADTPRPRAPGAPTGDPLPAAPLYADSLALLTDLYELTMAYGYFSHSMHEREAVFTLSFRKQPFDSGFAVACGIEPALDFLERLAFTEDDVGYLATLTGHDGEPLFSPDFLDYLRAFRFDCDVDAVQEGTVVFAHTPVLRVRGPLLHAQIVESAVLNLVNFQTLIATKAARVVLAAGDDPVLEFGLRRAQGIDGALAASRAAHVGGCAATSNVLAGKRYGIPVAGTHAHSWVMAFDDELTAFEAFADSMPGNCVLLVDTYDTLEGVRNAVRVGRRLRERGHELLGIRLDSGDLAYLSIEARRILDEAGFPETTIYASNELDETIIQSLKLQGARIGSWGVGTRLVTGGDQPALGGTYKLSALRSPTGDWIPRVKLSEQTAKVSTPGILQVRRFSGEGAMLGDMVFDERLPIPSDPWMIDPLDPTRRKQFGPECEHEDLLRPALRRGTRIEPPQPLAALRSRVRDQIGRLHPGVTRFVNPHRYPVGLEAGLHDLRTRMILDARRAD